MFFSGFISCEKTKKKGSNKLAQVSSKRRGFMTFGFNEGKKNSINHSKPNEYELKEQDQSGQGE